MKCITTVWMTHIMFVYHTDGMCQYINSARLWARNERILLLKMLNIWGDIQRNFTERTAKGIPCLINIHVRALINIVIETRILVLTIHVPYTSLLTRHVSIFFSSYSGSRSSNRHMKNAWIIKNLIEFINSSLFCIWILCKLFWGWCEEDRKFSHYSELYVKVYFWFLLFCWC